MFMRVDLLAPFSPSRAWISPGSTTRSMWSLATRSPKCLVMPRSSSLSASSPVNRRSAVRPPADHDRQTAGAAGFPDDLTGTGEVALLGLRGRGHLHGTADDVLLQLVQLALQVGRHLGVEVVERSQLY